jgi:hypothetical protein
MVDSGPDQGRRIVETAGVAALHRGFQPAENTELNRKLPFMDGHYAILVKANIANKSNSLLTDCIFRKFNFVDHMRIFGLNILDLLNYPFCNVFRRDK